MKNSVTPKIPQTKERLRITGHDSVPNFAPKSSTAVQEVWAAGKLESRKNGAGIPRPVSKVILDVVFNHTAEGMIGPNASVFAGWNNAIFYSLADDNATTRIYAGTGKYRDANHPVCGTISWPRSAIGRSRMHVRWIPV